MSSADIDIDSADLSLRGDLLDLWEAVTFLGEMKETFDAESNKVSVVFHRNDKWKTALSIIRQLLKKYHNHRLLPIRSHLHKWKVFETKFIPLLLNHSEELDLLYDLGKVLIFTTYMPGPQVVGVDRVKHIDILIEYKHAVVTCPRFLPSILNLMTPFLEETNDRFDQQGLNYLDITITLLKQLVEIPSSSRTSLKSGLGSSSNLQQLLLSEQLLLQYLDLSILETMVDLTRLLERPQFSRLTIVLLDFWFHVFKDCDPEVLFNAFKRQVLPRTFISSSDRPNSSNSPLKPDMSDPLARALHEEKSLQKLQSQSQASARHSRFGGLFVGAALGGGQRVASTVAGLSEPLEDTRGRRGRARGGGRSSKEDVLASRSELEIHSLGGAIGVHASGSMDTSAATRLGGGPLLGSDSVTALEGHWGVDSMQERCARGLARIALQLLETETIKVPIKSDDDADEVLEEETIESAYGTLLTVSKKQFMRDTQDITPDDSLRFFHFSTIVGEVAIFAAEKKIGLFSLSPSLPSDEAEKEGKDWSLQADPFLPLLDRWAMNNIFEQMQRYAKTQPRAAALIQRHMVFLLRLIFSLLEHGDSAGKDIAYTLRVQVLSSEGLAMELASQLRLPSFPRLPLRLQTASIQALYYSVKQSDILVNSKMGGSRNSSGKRTESFLLISQLAHPTALQALLGVLEHCNDLNAKSNYFTVQLLKRVADLPLSFESVQSESHARILSSPAAADSAGIVGSSSAVSTVEGDHGKYTHLPMMFHVRYVLFCARVLNDPRTLSRSDSAPVVEFCRFFADRFLRTLRKNPLLAVEALFWRHEKAHAANITSHYGLEGDGGAYGTYGGGITGSVGKMKTKAALEIDWAVEESRRQSAFVSSEVQDDFDATMDFDDMSLVPEKSKKRTPKKKEDGSDSEFDAPSKGKKRAPDSLASTDGAGGDVGRRQPRRRVKKAKKLESDDSDSESSISSSSSFSSSSDSDSSVDNMVEDVPVSVEHSTSPSKKPGKSLLSAALENAAVPASSTNETVNLDEPLSSVSNKANKAILSKKKKDIPTSSTISEKSPSSVPGPKATSIKSKAKVDKPVVQSSSSKIAAVRASYVMNEKTNESTQFSKRKIRKSALSDQESDSNSGLSVHSDEESVPISMANVPKRTLSSIWDDVPTRDIPSIVNEDEDMGTQTSSVWNGASQVSIAPDIATMVDSAVSKALADAFVGNSSQISSKGKRKNNVIDSDSD